MSCILSGINGIGVKIERSCFDLFSLDFNPMDIFNPSNGLTVINPNIDTEDQVYKIFNVVWTINRRLTQKEISLLNEDDEASQFAYIFPPNDRKIITKKGREIKVSNRSLSIITWKNKTKISCKTIQPYEDQSILVFTPTDFVNGKNSQVKVFADNSLREYVGANVVKYF